MHRTALITVAFATLVSTTVFAAPRDPTTLGFPIGEKSRIHTHLDLAFGFDTNPLRGDEGMDPSSTKLQVRPGLAVNVPGTSFQFDLGAKLSIVQYFDDVIRPNGDDVSTEVGGDVRVALTAGGPDSIIAFELEDFFARTPTFYFDDLLTVASQEVANAITYNAGRAMLVVRPGGGALEFRAGYINTMAFYDGLPNGIRNGAAVEAKLKFLPKTAAFFSADVSFFSDIDDEGPADLKRADLEGTPFNVEVGLRGQLTSRITTVASVGFGDALNEEVGGVDQDQRTVIAQARFEYAFTDSIAAYVGYQRRIFPIIVARSFIGDGITVGTNIGVAENRLVFGAAGAVQFRSFATGDDATLFFADARATYWFFDFLSGTVAYQLLAQQSDLQDPMNPVLNEYTRHVVLGIVALRY